MSYSNPEELYGNVEVLQTYRKSDQQTNSFTFYCSFCGKSHHEVEKIVIASGTSHAAICNECIELAYLGEE